MCSDWARRAAASPCRLPRRSCRVRETCRAAKIPIGCCPASWTTGRARRGSRRRFAEIAERLGVAKRGPPSKPAAGTSWRRVRNSTLRPELRCLWEGGSAFSPGTRTTPSIAGTDPWRSDDTTVPCWNPHARCACLRWRCSKPWPTASATAPGVADKAAFCPARLPQGIVRSRRRGVSHPPRRHPGHSSATASSLKTTAL